MRDLALRARHEVADRAPHRRRPGRPAVGAAVAARPAAPPRPRVRRRPRAIGCPGCAGATRVEVDAELRGAPARVRRRHDPGRAGGRRRGRRRAGRRRRGSGGGRGPGAAAGGGGGRGRRGSAGAAREQPARAGAPAPTSVASGVPTSTSVALGHEQLADHAVLEDLDLDVGLVGLHDRDEVAAVHGVARLHEPLEHRCLGPCRRRATACGTRRRLSHGAASAARRPRPASTLGSAASSRCLAYGIGTSALHTRSTGRVEVVERLLHDPRADLGRDRAAAPALVDDDRAVRAAHRPDDRLVVERAQRAQVDHLGLDRLRSRAARPRPSAVGSVPP